MIPSSEGLSPLRGSTRSSAPPAKWCFLYPGLTFGRKSLSLSEPLSLSTAMIEYWRYLARQVSALPGLGLFGPRTWGSRPRLIFVAAPELPSVRPGSGFGCAGSADRFRVGVSRPKLLSRRFGFSIAIPIAIAIASWTAYDFAPGGAVERRQTYRPGHQPRVPRPNTKQAPEGRHIEGYGDSRSGRLATSTTSFLLPRWV